MPEFDSKYQGKIRNGRAYPSKPSRFEQLAANNLGIIYGGQQKRILVRSELIDLYDKYYDCEQYDHLQPWEQACSETDYVSIRDRKPRINYAFAKMLASRIASKLVGHGNYPNLSVEDDPDTTELIGVIEKVSMLQPRMMEPIRRLVVAGSVFVRFRLVAGTIKVEWYNSKYCYPEFDEAGELTKIEVRYVYEDDQDLDPSTKKPKWKWYRMELATMSDILYDNPEYKPGAGMPVFVEVDRVDHELGFVQGQWFRTTEEKHSPDGYSIVSDITDFIDEINYNLSQSSQAVAYNQDPQTLIKGMDEEEIGHLIKSSSKAWNLGREGDAHFLESGLAGVQRAGELRDKIRLGIQDISRVIMMDPEKMMGSAQSGKALELLHGPFIELLNEFRPMIEAGLIRLVLKMTLSVLIVNERGLDSPITIPSGYKPQSLDIKADWPPVFPLTMSDLKDMINVVTAATAANVLSREWGTRWLSKVKELGVEDVEAELARIAAQPTLNPFGSF